jgi:hypothetical protein
MVVSHRHRFGCQSIEFFIGPTFQHLDRPLHTPTKPSLNCRALLGHNGWTWIPLRATTSRPSQRRAKTRTLTNQPNTTSIIYDIRIELAYSYKPNPLGQHPPPARHHYSYYTEWNPTPTPTSMESNRMESQLRRGILDIIMAGLASTRLPVHYPKKCAQLPTHANKPSTI